MSHRPLLAAALLCCGIGLADLEGAKAGTPSPTPSRAPSKAPARGSSFRERLAAAKSVKVITSILGLEPGTALGEVRTKLDKLRDPNQPVKEEGPEPGKRDESEHKVFWQLGQTDFASVFVKADEKERVTSIAGFLRPGKEIPFDKIGELSKAPIQDERVAAWDVVRPKRPLIRVVAQGEDRKASSITIFVVKQKNGSDDE